MMRVLLSTLWHIVFFSLAAFVLLLFVNLAPLKPRIESATTALLGRKVVIGNNIKFRLVGGRPALLLHHVSIGADVKADAVALALRGLHPSRGVLVRAKSLKVGGVLLGDYDLPVTILKDGFTVKPLKGRLKDATLNGRVKYAGAELYIDGMAKKVPLDMLLGDSAQGDVDAKFRFAAKGKTPAQLLGGLEGRFMLTNNGGTLTSASLKFWSSGLLSSLLPGREDKTQLNCAIVDFNVKDGMADSRTIVADTSSNTIFAKGRIDLVNGKIDMVLKPNPKNMQLVSLATPMLITGPLANPTVTPEAGGMVQKIGGMLLGMVNPALALLPLLETGFDDYQGSCAEIVRAHEKRQ